MKVDPPQPTASVSANDAETDIAIVGMSCRFPGARNPGEFWRNLSNGVESITRFSDQELLRSGVTRSCLANPAYVKAAPVLDEPGAFDCDFFGFSPMEARMMDPQHRILLELAHEAMEDAGCDPECYSGRVGVFAGSAMNTYFMNNGLSRSFAEDYIPTLIVNDKDFLSTRISYKLNLKGPSITVQTACSTSLVALHLARQSLLCEETDMALVGAVSVRVPHRAGYLCDGGGIVSPDGHVRAFDARANGTVFGSGGGFILLKRLADAIADGDNIHAVVKGSAVNNDGSEKAGYTAPSVNSQADAVVEALTVAGVTADEVGYVEAHGSGTPLGDPIEVLALTKAFRAFTSRTGYCAIGSVKTNIGHLDAAAGIAGLIKTVLALKHRQLPPALNYSEPNPEIDFAGSPFYVNTRLLPWKDNGPRRAGVMSTGMGGTNAHVVLEEAPDLPAKAASKLPQLLVLSARSDAALDSLSTNFGEFIRTKPDVQLDDVAYTLQRGRKAFSHRKAVVCTSRDEAVAALESGGIDKVACFKGPTRKSVIFLLPGIGDHYVGMGSDLYQNCAVFRENVDLCAELLRPHLGADIRQILYPSDVAPKRVTKGIDLRRMLSEGHDDPATQRLNQTLYAHPALFTIEYALARFWQALGVTPAAIVGHSMGEYVAACLAGVFSLEDALKLISLRARLANELPAGAMLAVVLSEAELLPLLDGHLSISLINGPKLCVVAGPVAEISKLEERLNEKAILNRQIRNGHPFHSKMLDPIAPAFAEELGRCELREPKIPFISNVTGDWITKSLATDPSYWAGHLTQPARFNDALAQVWKLKDAILLEVGPGKTLGVLAGQHPDRPIATGPMILSSLPHHYDNVSDVESCYRSVGGLWQIGLDIDWKMLAPPERRNKISLPTYPFERENYWIESIPAAGPDPSIIQKEDDPSKWFYIPSWKRSLPRQVSEIGLLQDKQKFWLVFVPDRESLLPLTDRLKRRDLRVIVVEAGERYEERDASTFVLRPDAEDDYDKLVQALQRRGGIPSRVVHAWNIGAVSSEDSSRNMFDQAQALGFYSLTFFTRALAKNGWVEPLDLFVLSRGIQRVIGHEKLIPAHTTLLGPCLVIPQEYPNIRIKSIDFESQINEDTLGWLQGEIIDVTADSVVAYRNNQRWLQTYERVVVECSTSSAVIFRQGGVYLITGGLGKVGYEISKYLAGQYQAKLVLVGRSPLNESVNTPEAEARTRKISELEKLGSEILYLDADVADRKRLSEVLAKAELRFGALHGVIHSAGVVKEQRYCEVKDIDRKHGGSHFQVKAQALVNLEELLQGRPLDFVLLVSSLASALGGIGHAAYAASSLYMDSFAQSRDGIGNQRWLSVNFDFWLIDGHPAVGSGFGETIKHLGMKPAEALRAMEAALSLRNVSQLMISTGDLNARIDQWVKLDTLRTDGQSNQLERTTLRPPVDLPGEEENLPAETEDQIRRIWQKAFGITRVGTNDNFADLGGHSLLAIKIVSELRRTFQIDLPIKALFDAPTVAELADYVKERKSDSPRKNETSQDVARQRSETLLDRLQRENPKLLLEDAFYLPRWFIQQKTWLDDPANSDSAVYNYPLLIRIRGPLNRGALEWSLQEIIRRHQTLRSVFRAEGEELIQLVTRNEREHSVPVTDLRDLSQAERDERSYELALREARRPFDLARGPLARANLQQLADDDHVLQFVTHQLVFDDWSTGALSQELSELYRAFSSGKASGLTELSFQYGDFVRSQQERIHEEKSKSKLAGWKQQRGDATGFYHLPLDFPRPAKSKKNGLREQMTLSAELAASLNKLARQEHVSLFMVLLTGFQSLLYRRSQGEEIGVGSCGANRSSAEVEGLIGRFGNAMLLRTSFSGQPTFRECLKRVREAALKAYSDQDIAFGELLKEAGAGSTPPFQVMFILQNAPRPNSQASGLTIDWSTFDAGTAAYDLDVWIKSEPGLEIAFEYNVELFRTATIKQLLGDYQVILEEMVNDPGKRISLPFANGNSAADLWIAGGGRNGAKSRSAQPAGDVEEHLVTLWQTAIKTQPIGLDDNFFELGGDSLLAARLFAQLESVFQVDLPLSVLLEAPTIRELAKRISDERGNEPFPCLIPVQPKGTRSPLFCVHGHMGEIFYCRTLAETLGPDQPVLGLRSKRGGQRNHTIEEMASGYLREIRAAQPSGPYYLSGYCLGGMVAYEMARRLKDAGEEIGLLALFNTPAPGCLKGWPWRRGYLAKKIAHELKALRSLSFWEKLSRIAAKSSGFASLTVGVLKMALWNSLPILSVTTGRRQAQRFLSIGNINVAAAKTYQPLPYSGRIILFATSELSSLYSIDPSEGWNALAAEGVESHMVDGDNVSMFHPKFIATLGTALKSCLERAWITENEVTSRDCFLNLEEPRPMGAESIAV